MSRLELGLPYEQSSRHALTSTGYSPLGKTALIPAAPRVIEALISSAIDLKFAVADLVDNSIDANATKIVVRLHIPAGTSGELSSSIALSVWDNGDGMNDKQLEAAVALSDLAPKQIKDLGKFGVGLKAASFGKSKATTVFSVCQGSETVGVELFGGENNRSYRRIAENENGDGFKRSFAPKPVSGTIVRWEQLRDVSQFRTTQDRRKWATKATLALASHLGVVFAKFLKSDPDHDGTEIEIIEVNEHGGTGIPRLVRKLGLLPGGLNSGETVRLSNTVREIPFELDFVISPKGFTDPDLERATESPKGSGLFIYRNKRLVRAGGWDGLIELDASKHELARLVFEVPPECESKGLFEVSHDKSGCRLDIEMRDAILSSVDNEGKPLDFYLRKAAKAQKNRTSRPPSPPLAPLVVGEEYTALNQALLAFCDSSSPKINVSFKSFPEGENRVFNFDAKSRTMSFNKTFEELFTANNAITLTTILVGVNRYLTKNTLNKNDLFEIETWNRVLWRLLNGKDESREHAKSESS